MAAVALPDPPDTEVLTPEQWTTVLAIADTVIPSICSSQSTDGGAQLRLSEEEYQHAIDDMKKGVTNPPDDLTIRRHLGEKASSNPAFRRELQRTLALHVHEDSRKGIATIISLVKLVSTNLASLPLTAPQHPGRLSPLQRRLQTFP